MRIDKMLGLEFPIFQGGMANIATGEFAAAVSNAGALGIIGSGGMHTETLRENIRRAKEETDRPFGVNLMLMSREVDEMARLIAEEKVPVVTTGAGSPAKYLDLWHEAGARVFPVVSSVTLAKRLERDGADGLIAEGCESGGHVGEMTTMVLLPEVVDAVSIPVLGAGGIADGRQMAAAFTLGASGVQIGTRFLYSEECPIHENYRNMLLRAKDNGTTVIGRISGTPVRVLKNPMAREYIKKERQGADKMELEEYTLGAMRRAVRDGDTKTGSLMAGQTSGMIGEIKPVRAILEELMDGYEAARKKAAE